MNKFLILFCLLPSIAYAEIGVVESFKGNINIDRNKNIINGTKQTPIESMDSVITKSESEANLKFKDGTAVRITPNSRLLIDDFVYDPSNSDAGKISIKAAMGTIRYASGQIAKNDPQKVAIKTPTATIAVRGTDFAMTVDEIGRSLVVLLPSCNDENKLKNYDINQNCAVGEIKVSTEEGFVILNQAFTATAVYSSSQNPTPPIKITPNINIINNNIFLNPPSSVTDALNKIKKEEEKKKIASLDLSDDENKVASDNSKSKVSVDQINILNAAKIKLSATAVILSNCNVFNLCWKDAGLNQYIKVDKKSNSTIYIGINEKTDNTTYTIYQNVMDPEIKITGDGQRNKVTIRQYDK